MMVTVNASLVPTFTQLGAYCQNDTPGTLPTTSNNGITGTWSPATISTATPGTTTYTFTPAVGQCAVSATMMVTVNPGLVPAFTQLGAYCQNDTPGTLPTTSNNGITGTWSPATISTATPGTTTYTFTPTIGQCATTATMMVTVMTLPVAIPTDLSACDNGTGQATFILTSLNNTVNNGSGSPVNWFLNSNETGLIVNPGSFTSGSTSVYAVVTDGVCSSMPVQIVLLVTPNPTVGTNAQAISCNNASDGSINLTVSGGMPPYNYDWNVNTLDGTEDPTGLVAGIYNVTVSDTNGCLNSASIVLNQPAALSINCGQANPVSTIGGSDGAASITITGGTAPYILAWSGSGSGSQNVATSGTTVIAGLGGGIYSLILTDDNGCTVMCEFTISEPGCNISISVIEQNETCPGSLNGSIEVTISGGTAPFIFDWNDNALDGTEDPMGLPPGLYNVTITDANGCIGTVEATIDSPEELMLDLGDDRTIKLGDSTLINAQVNFDIAQLQWNPSTNLSTPDASDTYAAPRETTAYRLSASDANGCTISDVVTIFVNKQRSVFIPNVFSPNDDGFNDHITVFAGGDVLEIKSFRIFDRWGNMLYHNGPFQPNDLRYGWDGTFDGKPMNSAVYVFYAEVLFLDGATEIFKGDVTLMR